MKESAEKNMIKTGDKLKNLEDTRYNLDIVNKEMSNKKPEKILGIFPIKPNYRGR